jgi:IclR family KDG regulon transcriptional repressor
MKDNRSVLKILAILQLVAKHEHGITLGEIYRALDYPKSTTYDILQTLYKADAVYYKDPRLKNYVIGSKMFAIGSVYAKNSNLIESSSASLKQFAETYNRVVSITKRVDEKIIYVYKYQPSQSKINILEEIGSINHYMDSNITSKMYRYFDKAVLDKTLSDYKEIRKQYYLMNSASDSDHACIIACPVWNFEKRVVGVITTYDLMIESHHRESIAEQFKQIAYDISRKLGYTGDFND